MIASREFAVAEARSWLDTPYRLRAMVKKGGCDCVTLLLCVWRACGIIGDDELGMYSGDWFLHTTDERYYRGMLRYASKIAEGVAGRGTNFAPGNVVLMRTAGSKLFNHGGIITAWPMLIHSLPGQTVREVNAQTNFVWAGKFLQVFDPWVKAENGTA